jgi:hypothetical protein
MFCAGIGKFNSLIRASVQIPRDFSRDDVNKMDQESPRSYIARASNRTLWRTAGSIPTWPTNSPAKLDPSVIFTMDPSRIWPRNYQENQWSG